MTYDELADRLGIAFDSARKLAKRRRWARRPGNDGRVRVDVPVDYLRDTPRDVPEDSAGDVQEAVPPVVPQVADNAVHLLVARLEVEVAGLKALVDSERSRAEAEARRADAAERDRDRWHELAVRPWWRRLVG